MYIIVILIVLLIFVILINITKSKLIEGYDARYSNITFPSCAEFCKITNNCYGFGYDKQNQVCYPSQLPILGIPIDSIYKAEYSYNNATCNKVKAITTPSDKPSFEERRSNSIYVCAESYDKQPQYYFHNKGEFKNIGEGKNIDNIFDVEIYSVKPYNWPRNKFDYDQKDLLLKYRENQSFTSNNITDLNRIIDEPSKQQPVKAKNPSEQTYDIRPQNIKTNLDELVKKINKTLIPKKVINKKNNNIIYKSNDNYNDGIFLMDYKCIKDIPLDRCLKYCSDNKDCKAVEWNSFYENNHNVCCPYKQIGNFTKRDNDKVNGKFYEKING
jgi:hypothetical protein